MQSSKVLKQNLRNKSNNIYLNLAISKNRKVYISGVYMISILNIHKEKWYKQ